jgi:hypothetical protein
MAWVAALAIFAASCGASGDKKASSTTTKPKTTTTASTTTTTSTTEPTTEDSTTTTTADPADAARAKAANIVAKDFPTGWTAAEHTTGESTFFAKCASDIDLENETTAQAASDEFSRQVGTSQTQANSLTRILSSEDVAHSVIAKIADPAFVKCTENLIKSTGLKPGTEAGSLSPVAINDLGDEAAGIDGQLSGVDSGTKKQAKLGVSIVAIRTGDLVTVLTGASLNGTQPGDGALFNKLAQSIAQRQKS